jgi:hypothetical protein
MKCRNFGQRLFSPVNIGVDEFEVPTRRLSAQVTIVWFLVLVSAGLNQ